MSVGLENKESKKQNESDILNDISWSEKQNLLVSLDSLAPKAVTMMDWVYMAPELPGQDLFAGSGQDRIGFAVGDDYVVDPGAVQALQVNYPLHYRPYIDITY